MKIRILSIMMALTMVLSAFLTGCGKEEGYAYEKYDSVGTMDGESIDFRFVYFSARCEQASVESYYYQKNGVIDIWGTEVTAGETLEQSVKKTIMEDLQNMLILEKYAAEQKLTLTDAEKKAIANAAASFMANNSEDAIAKMGATLEVVERYLTLYTISNKAYEAIIANANTDFPLSDYKRSTASYIVLPKKDYNFIEAKEILDDCIENYDTLTGTNGKYKPTKLTFGEEGLLDKNISQDTMKILREMVSGEVHKELIETSDAYLIIKMVEEFDTEESTKAKESLIAAAEKKMYEEKSKELKEKTVFVINEEAWAAIKFDVHFAITK